MTRQELEADIALLETILESNAHRNGGDCAQCQCTRRSIAMRRQVLARMDGPAEGLIRVRIGVSVKSVCAWHASGRDGIGPYDSVGEAGVKAATRHGPDDRFSWVVADVPIPGYPEEFSGEVEP